MHCACKPRDSSSNNTYSLSLDICMLLMIISNFLEHSVINNTSPRKKEPNPCHKVCIHAFLSVDWFRCFFECHFFLRIHVPAHNNSVSDVKKFLCVISDVLRECCFLWEKNRCIIQMKRVLTLWWHRSWRQSAFNTGILNFCHNRKLCLFPTWKAGNSSSPDVVIVQNHSELSI